MTAGQEISSKPASGSGLSKNKIGFTFLIEEEHQVVVAVVVVVAVGWAAHYFLQMLYSK